MAVFHSFQKPKTEDICKIPIQTKLSFWKWTASHHTN